MMAISYPACVQYLRPDNFRIFLITINCFKNTTYLAGCFAIWTGGFAFVPYDLNDFRWVLTPGTNKPVSFTNWQNGEPGNYVGGQEDAIMMRYAPQYYWADTVYDVSLKPNFLGEHMCYVCELEV